jgi:hypothetical protein
MDGYRVPSGKRRQLPNAIAAMLLYLRDQTAKIPHVYFRWTRDDPITFCGSSPFGERRYRAPVTRGVASGQAGLTATGRPRRRLTIMRSEMSLVETCTTRPRHCLVGLMDKRTAAVTTLTTLSNLRPRCPCMVSPLYAVMTLRPRCYRAISLVAAGGSRLLPLVAR